METRGERRTGLSSSLLVGSAHTLVAPDGKPGCDSLLGGAKKTIATSTALFKPDMGCGSSPCSPLVPPVVSSCVSVLLDREHHHISSFGVLVVNNVSSSSVSSVRNVERRVRRSTEPSFGSSPSTSALDEVPGPPVCAVVNNQMAVPCVRLLGFAVCPGVCDVSSFWFAAD